MPEVLRIGRFRFSFYSNENAEPPHVHVKAAGKVAKFWLDPVSRAANHGFKPHELNEIERLVVEYGDDLIGRWNEFFTGGPANG